MLTLFIFHSWKKPPKPLSLYEQQSRGAVFFQARAACLALSSQQLLGPFLSLKPVSTLRWKAVLTWIGLW